MLVTLEDKFVTLYGTAFGVHYDSTDAYPIDGVTVNVRKMNGPKDIGEVVTSAVADENGEYSVEVPRDDDQLYAIEVLDDGHHENDLKTNNYRDPIKYYHVFKGNNNNEIDPYLLSTDIDKIYFYGVVKGTVSFSGAGVPLAKWDKTEVDSSTGERYAAPKTWVQEHPTDTSFSNEAIQYVNETPDSVTSTLRPEVVSDSSGADMKIFFVSHDHPKLPDNAMARYIPNIDAETNTHNGVEMYVWKGLSEWADVVREHTLREDYDQLLMALHDISIAPYDTSQFFGDHTTYTDVPRPTEFDINHIFSTYSMLPKGW